MNATLTRLERESADILARIRRLEEIPILSAAKMLHKSPRWVRANLPVIVHSQRSQHVRAADVEAYQQKRTLRPLNGDKHHD